WPVFLSVVSRLLSSPSTDRCAPFFRVFAYSASLPQPMQRCHSVWSMYLPVVWCLYELLVASERAVKYIDHTEWHRCIVWGKLAEYAKTLKKGAHLSVEGEMRSRETTDKKTARKQRIWEVRVSSILKLDRAEKAGPDEAPGDEFNPEEEAA